MGRALEQHVGAVRWRIAPAGEGFRQGVVAGADVLRRRLGPVALCLEAGVEGAGDVVIELVAARHGLCLRLRELHQFRVDGHGRQAIVGPIAGNHRSSRRRIDLGVGGGKAAIEGRLARQFALAGAGAEACQRRHGEQAQRMMENHAVPGSPTWSIMRYQRGRSMDAGIASGWLIRD